VSPLEKSITAEIESSRAEAAVALLIPSTGVELMINADRSFHPASTFKLAVMMEAFRKDAEGGFLLDSPIPIVNEFPSILDGSPYSLSPQDDSDPELYHQVGESLPARNLVERMITQSGNLATNVLLQHLPPSEVTSFMHHLGAKDLIVKRGVEDNKAYAAGLNNATTARAIAIALQKLATHQAVSKDADTAMLDILHRQKFTEGIPRLLPPQTAVAHKTGWNTLLYHDAAIITPAASNPYILVVLTQGLSESKGAPDLVARISKLVYDARHLAN
jgi:beta-lactamase class A